MKNTPPLPPSPASDPHQAIGQPTDVPAPLPTQQLRSSPFGVLLRSCNSFGWACGLALFALLRVTFKLLVICYFLFCALFLVLRYGVLPNVDRYKGDIEQIASKTIGRDLRITTLHASWNKLNPVLELGNIIIHDQQGKVALVLPQVSASLSWTSVIFAELRLDKLEVMRPSLAIEKQPDGKLYVAGFLIDTKPSEEDADKSKGLDWVLAQHEIVIRDGSVSWTDLQRKAPALQLSGVNFILTNQWRRHQFAFKAVPPATLAAPLDIRGDFQHPVFTRKISDFSNWTGDLYADVSQSDLATVKAYIDLPADIKTAFGSVRSWVRWDDGRIADLTADIKLTDVLGTFRKDLPVLDMQQVSGRIVASERAALGVRYLPSLFGQAGHQIALINFSMKARDGQLLPATSITENFTPGENGQPEKVELYAKQLDLQTLANFAEHLPLPADQRRMLIDFAPKGQLKNFRAKWQGSYPAIASYSVTGEFNNLSMQPQSARLAEAKSGNTSAKAAVPAIPGFDNLSGTLDASDKGGNFTIDSQDLALQMSGYFVDPLMPFKKLQMQASWQFLAQDKLAVQLNQMEFQQDQMTGSLSGKYIMSMRQNHLSSPNQANRSATATQSSEVDLMGKLSGFDLKQIDRFIPANAPEDLRHWLIGALLDGRADDVTLRVKGDLAHFPFAVHEGRPNHQGEFWVKGNIVNGKLDFAPGHLSEDGKNPLWPVIDSINGSFIFDRAKMEIRVETAKTNGADLSKVKAVIPDLLSHDGILNIDGTVNGNLQTMLQYVNASPVDGWLGHFLKDSKASATAQLGLKLQLPLRHMVDSKVQGALQFAGNDVLLQSSIPMISGVNGKLEFNEKGVALNTLKGTILGGAAVVTGGSQKDGSIRVKLDGFATADGLRKNFPVLAKERLVDKIQGSAYYTTSINVKKRQPEILIESSLQGLALNFPAPLRKLANENMALRFEMLPQLSNDANLIRDELKLNLGNVIAIKYQRQKSVENNANWQVLRGGIGVNAPAPEPDSGLNANIDFKSLHVDEWRSLMSLGANTNTKLAVTKEGVNTNESGDIVPGAIGNTNTQADFDVSAYLEPSVLAVRTAELHVMGKKLDNVVLGATHQKGLWQANIDSSQASGYLSWSESANVQGLGNVLARLSKLTIPQSAASDVTDLLEGKSSGTQIPSLDIVADNFELFNKKLGRLELIANNFPLSTGREWRMQKISLKNEDAELKGSGKWSSRAGEGLTNLNYVLDISDAGKLLDRLGFANVLRGGRGKLQGDVTWNGLPFALDVPSMTGQVQLELAAGQFLKVDPGAAKLLGVLSLQSLPRRLTLDFRDVFSDGFAFDSILGTAQIQQGTARTENLKMRSVNATVLMDGTADLVKESQNLHVAVIPEINAGTASVVYGLAVNPVIGLGTFLAQLFLREPLARAFTYEYSVAGSWKEPTVTKMDHKEAQNTLPKAEAILVK
ncbi:YhdP family protein [Undibacterium sp. RTI2.1]|uniref:YhdP family protein n=1 Tax=unclassified Undibacterium TaxID=2630295 RepID=UPI002B23C83C|nr:MULTISPECIES: YhdP family protein [unclassified Undibacterium]MEB0031948.1 YhdP family protein [Undibacterium sp. RTI2.1]MEB0114870.1 YhdP family protein [Undibacterium sp. RTI2.2]